MKYESSKQLSRLLVFGLSFYSQVKRQVYITIIGVTSFVNNNMKAHCYNLYLVLCSGLNNFVLL